MTHDAREFWEALGRSLPEDDRGRDREIARSVLMLLRERIPPQEAQHLKSELPGELKELWASPGIGLAEERGSREIRDLDHNQFLGRVKESADLPDFGRAARATAAVFGAVRGVISDTESGHIEQSLPSGLKELWRGERGGGETSPELGESRFWELLEDRIEGRVPATKPDIARAVLTHLAGRLPPDLTRRVEPELPAELREGWRAARPESEQDEEPERFLGRVGEDIGIPGELELERYATSAVFGALRHTLPDDVADQVQRRLPEELQGLWEAS